MGGSFSKTQNTGDEKETHKVATSISPIKNTNTETQPSAASQQPPSTLPEIFSNVNTSLPSLRDAVADMKRAVGWSTDVDPLEADLRVLDPQGSRRRRKRSVSSSRFVLLLLFITIISLFLSCKLIYNP